MSTYNKYGEKLIDPGIEDRLEDEFYELIEKRKEYARQWKNSGIPVRYAIRKSIKEIHIRIKNIFKELLENDFTLSEKMQKFKEYTFPKDLKDDIIFYPEKETGAIQSKLENKKTRLEYKEVEPLFIKLKNNDYILTEIDKDLRERGSFKSQRSKFISKNLMRQNFKSILDSIYNNEYKRMPLDMFLQQIGTPSKYYSNVLLRSFFMSCNSRNGKFYERYKKYKVEYVDARNEDTGEKERCIALLPSTNN